MELGPKVINTVLIRGDVAGTLPAHGVSARRTHLRVLGALLPQSVQVALTGQGPAPQAGERGVSGQVREWTPVHCA